MPASLSIVERVRSQITSDLSWTARAPTTEDTWLRVRNDVANYLIVLWRNGELMGERSDQAFYVKCGLQTTMTQLDVAEGRLIVEVGFAPVKPAEFIVFRIEQLQRRRRRPFRR